MKHVYVLRMGIKYEGYDAIGVYNSMALAEAAAHSLSIVGEHKDVCIYIEVMEIGTMYVYGGNKVTETKYIMVNGTWGGWYLNRERIV